LIRYFVLFVIDLKTRRVEIAGISRGPDGEWMKQAGRNLTDCDDGFLVRDQRTHARVHPRMSGRTIRISFCEDAA
jgi:hypothetical protein